MGRRGPRRKIAALDRLDGNPGKRNYDDWGIETLGVPFVPEHLPDDARGCIDTIRASMPPNVYAALDSFHLAAFAMAWAIHKRAALEISNPDFRFLTKTKRGGDVESPWVKIATKQAAIMASLGDRLGLDPKSRAALKMPSAKAKNKFAGLLGADASAHPYKN